jgi:hypothetical protein
MCVSVGAGHPLAMRRLGCASTLARGGSRDVSHEINKGLGSSAPKLAYLAHPGEKPSTSERACARLDEHRRFGLWNR